MSDAEIQPAPPRPAGARWTDEQWSGITATGRSVLVSAAAGSGKTAMLAERCAYLVCEAPQPDRCDVTDLLVVTFTDAAAVEMRSRIQKALRDKVASAGSARLSGQLNLLDQMSVSTLHAFCARVLRQHFHRVGLDPAFSVLDGEEAKLLRNETAREVFEDRYELDDSGEFTAFIDAYADGRDETLVARVIRTHEMLASVVEPDKWLRDSAARIELAAEQPLGESELGQRLRATIQAELESASARCEGAIAEVARLGGFPGYEEALDDCRKILAHLRKLAATSSLDDLSEALPEEFPRLKSVKNTVPNKEQAKAQVDAVRKDIKEGGWRKLLQFSEQQWREGLASITPHMQTFVNLVREFGRRYASAKASIRALDFSDLERFTLRVLRAAGSDQVEPSDIALAYQRRFAYVLVDEYQDINQVQDAIIRLLSRESGADPGRRANLFCVGDVKQSIYGFRLAEPRQFLRRAEELKDPRRGSVIPLPHNFRSRAPLLEAINEVFERLMTRSAVEIEYDEAHRLRAGALYPPGTNNCFAGAPIELHVLSHHAAHEQTEETEDEPVEQPERAEREAWLIARRIRRIVGLDGSEPMCVLEKAEEGRYQSRPARFSDIVVLLRSVQFKAQQYAGVLRQAGIPVFSQSSAGFFDAQEIRDMLALLSLLSNTQQDIPLAAVLRSPLLRLKSPEDLLARIRLSYPDDTPFHQAAAQCAADDSFPHCATLREIFQTIDGWRRMAYRRPLDQAIADIYADTGFVEFCSGLPDGPQRQANLLHPHERAQQFGSFHRQGLERFIAFMSHLRDEDDLGQPQVVAESQDVVRIMSVHQSKGLEFPIVILPDLGKTFNSESYSGVIVADREAGLGLEAVDFAKQIRYPSLASEMVKMSLRRQMLAEEMRVLYVAMTRAREHLILVGISKEKARQSWSATPRASRGPLPTDTVLRAANPLDWIGPVALLAGDRHFQLIDAVDEGPIQAPAAADATPSGATLQRMARFETLGPEAPLSDEAREVIERVTHGYAFDAYAHLPAARSVTGQKSGMARSEASLADIDPGTPDDAAFCPPRFFGGRADVSASLGERERKSESGMVDMPFASARPAHSDNAGLMGDDFAEVAVPCATDRGVAHHVVLQHLDFTRPCDDADVAEQIADMLARHVLFPAQAEMVNVSDIVWLCKTDLGALLRAERSTAFRELPVYFPEQVTPAGGLPSTDPRDRVMVRGRLDLLLDSQSEGLIIVDYKTDAVASHAVGARVDIYRPQLEQYRAAIERITGKRIAQTLLVFLAARRIVAV